MMVYALVSGSRSLLLTSDQDGRTTLTPHNLFGQVVVCHINFDGWYPIRQGLQVPV